MGPSPPAGRGVPPLATGFMPGHDSYRSCARRDQGGMGLRDLASTNRFVALALLAAALGLAPGCAQAPRRRMQSPEPAPLPGAKAARDPGSSRADAPAPSQPRAPAGAGDPADAPRVARSDDAGEGGVDEEIDTDLDRPRAERRGGGGGPTMAEVAEDEAKDEDEDDPEDEVDGYCKPDLLMHALGRDESPIRMFGWVQGSLTANPRLSNDGQNFGVNPNNLANAWTFQQIYLVLEKRADQGDRADYGFRVDNLFGNDWQNFHNVGFLDHAFRPDQFGWNPVQMYGEVHLPWLTRGGLEIKGGRFYALPGYEDGMAPARPLLSTGYLFSYSHPFTHLGMMTTWHVTDRLNLFNGAVNGWDRWANQNDKWGYAGGLSWDSMDDRTNVTLTANLGPDQISRDPATEGGPPPPPSLRAAAARPYVNGQRPLGYGGKETGLFTQVVVHEWTDRLSTIAEADEAFQDAVPGLGPRGGPRNASWYGLSGWTLYELTDTLTGVARAEVFRDNNGVRTGFADTFYESTLGLIDKPRPWLWLRPEVRYDWSQKSHPYDDGRHRSQFTFGFDVLLLF